jgi:hypothetical protein
VPGDLRIGRLVIGEPPCAGSVQSGGCESLRMLASS